MADLNSLWSSEEQQVHINRLENVPKLGFNERAFFNDQKNSIEETHTYSYDGLNYQISLPAIPNSNDIISSLLSIRHLVLRIAVFYEHKTTAEMVFGSGLLITNKLVLTSAHIFDPIQWRTDKVSYARISVAFCDPTPHRVFSLLNPHQTVFQAKIVRRGLIEDNIDDYTELNGDHTDIALLELNNEVTNIATDQYFDPKLVSESSKLGDTLLNTKLYLVGYQGELIHHDELKPYSHLNGFNDLTIDKLNRYHHVDYKSVSVGKLISKECENDQYHLHNCSALPGASGSVILDCYGRLEGIHIGVSNSPRDRTNETFFSKDTYNKYVSIKSKQFKLFIEQTIIPNINSDEIAKKWRSGFK